MPKPNPSTGNLAAANIRAELGRQNVTQRELARRVNRSVMWVNRRVNGDGLGLDDLDAIAAALNVPLSALLQVDKATA